MNCAWCGTNEDGSDSHGICDACMLLYFRVDPATIHAEITAEETEQVTKREKWQVFPIWKHLPKQGNLTLAPTIA